MDPVTLGAAKAYTDEHANDKNNPHNVTTSQVNVISGVTASSTLNEFPIGVSVFIDSDNPDLPTSSYYAIVTYRHSENNGLQVANQYGASGATLESYYRVLRNEIHGEWVRFSTEGHTHNASDIVEGTLSISRVPRASQSQAEAGTSNSYVMTPQRTKQAIDRNAAKIASGTYVGNGASNRTISVGFTPLLVYITFYHSSLEEEYTVFTQYGLSPIGLQFITRESSTSASSRSYRENTRVPSIADNGFMVSDLHITDSLNRGTRQYHWVAVG